MTTKLDKFPIQVGEAHIDAVHLKLELTKRQVNEGYRRFWARRGMKPPGSEFFPPSIKADK